MNAASKAALIQFKVKWDKAHEAFVRHNNAYGLYLAGVYLEPAIDKATSSLEKVLINDSSLAKPQVCPFCRKKPVIVPPAMYSMVLDRDKFGRQVKCQNSKCSAKPCVEEASRSLAIRRWNR